MTNDEHDPRIDETGVVRYCQFDNKEYDFETHCGSYITVFADRVLPRASETSSTQD